VATRRQGPFPNRIADVGVVKDLATHDLDLTGWVTGTKYKSVAAKTAHRSGRPHEDLVTVLGELDSGVIANHLVNWLSPLKERVSIVTGERGCFVADTLTADLTYFANGSTRTEWDAVSAFRGVSEGDVTRYAIPKREPLAVEHETFRDAVDGKQDAGIVTLRQGLRAVMVAEAVLDSARSGRTFPLDLP
jgi:UDP-N-acetylglucosamine 3-dehydrogenase